MTQPQKSPDTSVHVYVPETARPETTLTDATPAPTKEIGGRRAGLEPTRYGDWEKQGRCIDF